MKSNFVNTLRAFNRKERYYVFRELVTDTDPRVSHKFAERVEKVVGVRPDPEDCFLAVDYHLDWISSAVFLARSGKLKGGSPDDLVEESMSTPFQGTHISRDPVMTGSQEDVDALLAFQQNGTTHLVFIEAKADTGWSLSQLQSKGKRLLAIFGQPDVSGVYLLGDETVRCHLILLGPRTADGTREMKGDVDKVADSDAVSLDGLFPSWFYLKDEGGKISFKFMQLSSPSMALFKPKRISGKGDSVPWRIHSIREW